MRCRTTARLVRGRAGLGLTCVDKLAKARCSKPSAAGTEDTERTGIRGLQGWPGAGSNRRPTLFRPWPGRPMLLEVPYLLGSRAELASLGGSSHAPLATTVATTAR